MVPLQKKIVPCEEMLKAYNLLLYIYLATNQTDFEVFTSIYISNME